MKRSGFKRPVYERPPPSQPTRVLRGVAAVIEQTVVASPKAVLLRSKTYRQRVAELPCFHCGIEGRSQAAHSDELKGMGMKSSDDTCYPLCGPAPGHPGCHYLIGTAGLFNKEDRRRFEKAGAADTRQKLALSQ